MNRDEWAEWDGFFRSALADLMRGVSEGRVPLYTPVVARAAAIADRAMERRQAAADLYSAKKRLEKEILDGQRQGR